MEAEAYRDAGPDGYIDASQDAYPGAYFDAYPATYPETYSRVAPSTDPVVNPVEAPEPDTPEPDAPAAAYLPEGKLASALADHFGQGFDANFVDYVPEESPAWLQDGLNAGRNAVSDRDPAPGYGNYAEDFEDDGSPFSGGFDRRLAQQFTGEDGLEGFDGEPLLERPLSRRSLQWIRRNMTSLRIIVSLQRVTPPDPLDDKPRKLSGS